MEEVARFRGVTKAFGTGAAAAMALSSVDLSVRPGEFVSIMGPSGCGKSTLLNLLAGYDAPTDGEVFVDGVDIWSLSERGRSELRAKTLGFVVQSFDLLPRLTVRENVLVRLGPSQVRGAEADQKVKEFLDLVAVPSAAWERYPSELSGGEQQRVAMARALVAEPSLLLADEPTGNLDSTSGGRVLDLLRDLNAARKMSVLMVTHDSYAATVGHRTVTMRDGRIVHDVGSLEEHRAAGVSSIERASRKE